jgi:hypothetical protein
MTHRAWSAHRAAAAPAAAHARCCQLWGIDVVCRSSCLSMWTT